MAVASLRPHLALTAALVACAAATGGDVYVSPAGSDTTGDGSAAKPFATLPRAQAAVRALLEKPLVGNITVHVGAGTYFLRDGLHFGPLDSGRDGFRVRWVGPGTPADRGAVVHGGVKVPPSLWRRVGDTGVWAANVSALAPPPPLPPLLLLLSSSSSSSSLRASQALRGPNPTPAPTPNVTYSHCGSVLVGVSFNGNDIKSIKSGGIDACCQACASTPRCGAWSFCSIEPPATCGTLSHPVDCYLKTHAPADPERWDERVSGVPGKGCRPTYPPPGPPPSPPGPPGPPPSDGKWRFFNLLEDRVGGVLARTPDLGSGYLTDLRCKNSNTDITCPEGVLPPSLDSSDASVFANLGANWFTETRAVTGVTANGTHVTFEKGGAMGANDKVYIQGAKELVSEPGEWALDHEVQMLYLWPRNAAAMANGTADVVVATTVRLLDVRGDGWTQDTPGVGLARAIDFEGLMLSGSDFSADYLIFSGDRTNDTPQRLREGMVRFENATDVRVEGCALLDAGHSAFWLQGFSQNVTVRNCWIQRPGFCGAYFQGIFPGDTTSDSVGAIPGGPITSAAESDVNKGHLFENNMIYDYGTRVGHGSGFWFYQAGRTRLTRNAVQEGPRDAFGIYGIRRGVLPNTVYGKKMDFWSALDVLHTRFIEIDHNAVRNAVRDTSDAGALEYWGCGAFNTAHHNCFSDMDPGIPVGAWMNFLFQDDASHYLNFSSNIVFEVNGAGSEEAGMIKSVGSVFENNVIADSMLGHTFNICPYIEPAAQMIYRGNVFANITAAPSVALDTTVNALTSKTLAHSGTFNPAQYGFEHGPPPGWPPLAPTDPVVKAFDNNTYFSVQGYNISSLAPLGWDLHASTADPMLTRASDPAGRAPWLHECGDYVPKPGSPVYARGFQGIDTSAIGVDEGSFPWSVADMTLRDASVKIQAERYQRMRGLWRLGSFCVTGSSSKGFSFGSPAWARYDNVAIDCPAPCAVTVRFRSYSTAPSATRRIAFSRQTPAVPGTPPGNVVVTVLAAPSAGWVELNATVPSGVVAAGGVDLFMTLDGAADVDWFRFRSAARRP